MNRKKCKTWTLIWASVGQARLVIHILAKFSYAVGVASTSQEVFVVFKLLISILSAFNTIGLFILGFRPLKALAEIPKFSVSIDYFCLQYYYSTIIFIDFLQAHQASNDAV